MKTHQQIQAEANQVAILGQQFRAEQVAGGASLALVAESPALARFPAASGIGEGAAETVLLGVSEYHEDLLHEAVLAMHEIGW